MEVTLMTSEEISTAKIEDDRAEQYIPTGHYVYCNPVNTEVGPGLTKCADTLMAE